MTKTTKWINVGKVGAKCPKCDCHIHAPDVQSLIDSAYMHFVDAHVVGGSFD